MVAAPRDANRKIGLVGASSSDARTAVAVYVDPATHRLKVDAVVTSGLSSQTGVKDNEAVDVDDLGALVLGTDGSNYQILSVDATGKLQIDLVATSLDLMLGTDFSNVFGAASIVSATPAVKVEEQGTVAVTGTFWQVTQPISGEVTIGAATGGAGDLAKIEDAQHASGDVGIMALAVENEDQADLSTGDKDYTPIAVTKEGNIIVKQEGTITVTESNPISGFATSALQLADGHAVTIDNISTNEVYVRGSGAAGSAGAAVLTIQGIASMTPVAVTESSPISGFATSALQLADGHNVTVDNAGGVEVVQDVAADLKATVTQASAARTISSGSIDVLGDTAHDAADSGDPVKIGGRAQEPTAALEEVTTDNDRVDAAFDRQGRIATWMGYPVQSAVINCSTSGDNTIVAAQAAGLRIALIGCVIVSDGTTDVRWEDGAAGTAKTGQIPLQAREGFVMPIGPQPWFVGTAATLLNLELTAAISVHGIASYVVMTD